MMRLLLVFLGLFDLNAAVILSAAAFGVEIPSILLAFTSLTLFSKACIYIADIGSAMDIIIAILILTSIFVHLPAWLLFFGAAVIGFKGLRSFSV